MNDLIASTRSLIECEQMNALLLKALTDLKHRHTLCWCPHGLGDRFFPHHTAACELAQIVYVKAGGK